MAKPIEVTVIEKVFDFVVHTFPKELKKASKEFKKSDEAEAAKDERTYERGLLSWFLLERKTNLGLTPMELAYLCPLDCFTNRDRRIIKNFIEHTISLFEVKKIHNKDYLLENVIDKKEHLVNTIDFPDIVKEGEFIRALIVKKLEGGYFFHGNVLTYTKQDGLEIRDFLLKNIKKIKKRKKPKIEWEIRYKK